MAKKSANAASENFTKLIFECAVCKKVYKEPGMCQKCELILKPTGS